MGTPKNEKGLGLGLGLRLGLGLGLAFRKRGSLYSRWGPHIHVNMGIRGAHIYGVPIFL